MKILLTNDDGINAEGLKHLIDWAKTKGEVYVFAPKVEQSGKSHSIHIHGGIEFKKVDLVDGVEAYSIDSTPADCVRVAILAMQKKVDLVISGINRGFNLGGDIRYSGTVGACFEAAKLGSKALAFSTHWQNFDNAVANLDRIYQYICDNKMFDYTDILNVNIPEEGNEIVITKMGPPIYGDEFAFTEDTVTPGLVCYYNGTSDITLDTDATMTGHISISPLHCDCTDTLALDTLKKICK